MNPTEIVSALLRGAPQALFVTSLGTATSALRVASEDGPHLYMGGSMGSALAVALGVARKRPEREVVAVLGDGETLMGAGSLWTLSAVAPANVVVAVLNDGHYSITGGQRLGNGGRFAAVAAALGGVRTAVIEDLDAVEAAASAGGPALLEIRYSDRDWPGGDPFVDPHLVRAHFEAEARREPV